MHCYFIHSAKLEAYLPTPVVKAQIDESLQLRCAKSGISTLIVPQGKFDKATPGKYTIRKVSEHTAGLYTCINDKKNRITSLLDAEILFNWAVTGTCEL